MKWEKNPNFTLAAGVMDVKVGWVGVRGYGKRFWEVLDASPFRRQITSCFHPDATVANEAAATMRCSPFSDWKDFLGQKDLDAVVLAVPNEFHYSLAAEALRQSKHVFVEKPLTNHYHEAIDLVRLARERERVLAVGHNYRRFGFMRAIKAWLEQGRIGEVVGAEMNMSHGGGLKFQPSQWRWHQDKCPGGPLNMLGTHLIDASQYLFGEPAQVSAVVKNLYASTSAEDTAFVRLQFKSGVTVSLVTLYNSVSTERIDIFGTRGALRFSRWPEETLFFQPADVNLTAGAYEKIAYPAVNTQREIFEEFLRCVTFGEKPEIEGEVAAKTVEVLQAALLSQQKSVPVDLSPAWSEAPS